MSVFADRLKELRLSRGENQSDVAKLLGVSVQSYSAYEGVREPKFDFVCKLAQHYNVSADYLLGLTDIKTVDTNIKAICDYTGLSENTISELRKRIAEDPDDSEPIMQLFIDILVNSVEWFLIEMNIMSLLDYKNETNSIGSEYEKLLPQNIIELNREVNKNSFGLYTIQPVHEQIERLRSQILLQFESILDEITDFNKTKECAEEKWDHLFRRFRHSDPLATGGENNG